MSTRVSFNCYTDVDVPPEYFDNASRLAWENITAASVANMTEDSVVFERVHSKQSQSYRRRLEVQYSTVVVLISDIMERYGYTNADKFARYVQESILNQYEQPSTVDDFVALAISRGSSTFTKDTYMNISTTRFNAFNATRVLTASPSSAPTQVEESLNGFQSFVNDDVLLPVVSIAILLLLLCLILKCYNISHKRQSKAIKRKLDESVDMDGASNSSSQYDDESSYDNSRSSTDHSSHEVERRIENMLFHSSSLDEERTPHKSEIELSSADMQRIYHAKVFGEDKFANQSGDWIEKFSSKHQRPYWKNTVTNKSTWKNPFKTPLSSKEKVRTSPNNLQGSFRTSTHEDVDLESGQAPYLHVERKDGKYFVDVDEPALARSVSCSPGKRQTSYSQFASEQDCRSKSSKELRQLIL